MNKPLIRLFIWGGWMIVLTFAAMCIWLVVCGNSQTTESLKWLQFIQTVGTFLLPPILGAWIWTEDHRPFVWLKMDKGAHWSLFLLAVAVMLCALPGINLLADLNSRITLPESLASIEQIMKQWEEKAAALTESFLQAGGICGFCGSIALMALLPALAEELSFRGTLQQILTAEGASKARVHLIIWVTAFIFSAIHMQFYGFIPRMLLGAAFGYAFVWTGSLWVPVVMHFTNNACVVIAYYALGDAKNTADTFGAGGTWWIGVLSLLITSLGLLIFYRRTHKQ